MFFKDLDFLRIFQGNLNAQPFFKETFNKLI